MINPITDQPTLEAIRKALMGVAYSHHRCPACSSNFLLDSASIDEVFQAIDLIKDAPKRLLYERVGGEVCRMTAPVGDFEDAVAKANAFVKLTDEINVTHNFRVEEYQGEKRGWVTLVPPDDVVSRLGDT